MAVTDISELRKKRKARQTKNMLVKVFLVLLAAGAAIVAVLTHERWYPYVRDAVTGIPENLSGERDSAVLAEGLFPIMVGGGMGYQLADMDGSLAILDDSRFHVYSAEGKVMNESQHTFANPILDVCGSKALIYDEGGREFRLESKYKTIYSNTADDVIYLAELSKSDYAAVVTRSDKFLAMLRVYDGEGNQFFTYYSYDSRIIGITFTEGSSGCIVTTVSAQNGRLMSEMIRFDFNDTEPQWVSEAVPALAIDVHYANDGGIVMIGDTMTVCFDENGGVKSRYVYDDPLVYYDHSFDVTALLTENTDIRRSELITFTGSDCTSPVVTRAEEDSKKVFADNTSAYILSGSRIDVYTPEGLHTGEIILEDEYDNFCKSGKYIYLLGYDSINRIDYNS